MRKLITTGRTPHVPVEYENAVKALQACLDIDEAKYWSDAADAYQAWAKIHRSKDVEIKAKRLKLHAYRRMGELAKMLRPHVHLKGRVGFEPGSRQLLIRSGLTENEARAASRLARMSEEQFEALKRSPRPLSPTTACINSMKHDGKWPRIAAQASTLRTLTRKCDPREAARMPYGLVPTARAIAIELIEWLDAFEQALPKEQRK